MDDRNQNGEDPRLNKARGAGGIKRQRESPPPEDDVDSIPAVRLKIESDIPKPENHNGDENVSKNKPQSQQDESKANSSSDTVKSPTQRTSLSSCVEFGNVPKKNITVIPTAVQQNEDLGAPTPKVPKRAHYNDHTEEDETRYVEENLSKIKKTIPCHKTGDDSNSDNEIDDTSVVAEPQDRYFAKKVNVFTKDKYDFKTRRIDTTRLAVYTAKEKILNAIDNHHVVIIEGFTGCGKTTQVPQFILDKYCDANLLCNIAVTQPRRIAAISVAKRVCRERNWNMGTVVGYQVGMDSKKDKDNTLITYMTTGVLLQKLIGAKSFRPFTHIIIDEVHERDLNSDLLLLVIKKILQDDVKEKERHVKLILMSATLNAKKFSKYFQTHSGGSNTCVEESAIVKIQNAVRHQIEEAFLDHILQNDRELLEVLNTNLDQEKATIPEEMYTVAVDCIVGLDEADNRRMSKRGKGPVEKRGSVLIFLPGMEEINRLFRSLKAKDKIAVDEEVAKNQDYKDSDYYKWDIVPLHSTITNEEQQRVFDNQIDFRRKIILSTNIAESSVTVPDVMYVIDFCLTKSLCIDPYTNFTTLRMVWASVSQCRQRKGRTGRVCDGKVFRLVPQLFFSGLAQDTQPEMLRANLETVILQLKKLNLGSPKELLAMALDPPVVSGIERAVANLKELGALTISTDEDHRNYYDTCDGDITFLGQIMTDLPIPQQCSRLIMLGYCFGVMKEAIIIAAALSVKNPFSTPFIKSLDAYLSKLSWAKKSCSDLFAIYYVYKHWVNKFSESGDFQGSRGSRNQYNERQWARGAFVQLSVLREIKSTIELLEERLKKHNLKVNWANSESQSNDECLTKEASLMLKLAIAGAFYPNFFHRKRPDLKTYERVKSREVCGLDLYNTVWFKGFPGGHDGKMYAKYVADYLSFGLNVPSIKFDGQKVLATFDNRGEKIGPISRGVYRAVKRRQLRHNMEFPLSSKDLEKRTLDNWHSKLEKRRFTRCPDQIALPGMDIKKLYVNITHVESPGQFWVTYCKYTKPLDEMVQAINHELVHIPIPSGKVVPNALCLAPYLSTYYRAKILMVLPRPIDESLVYFVDYGNTCWVKNSALQDFSPSMVEKQYNTIPCLAVECRLNEIKPARIHGAGWHEKATLEFKQFAEGAPFLYLDIYSVSKSIISGRLIGHDSGNLENILNDNLIQMGFAEGADESTYSEFNYRARTRVHLQDNEERAAHNKEQIGEQLDFDFVEPPNDPDRSCNTLLRGPWSPLELDFQSLCQSSNTKQVKVDNNSVNSVVLDTEPTAPISRLLVAASVGIQDRTGSVLARDSTMMPSVPGLLPLLSMLFAPKIELRVDIRQTRYTGVLCGLGTAPGQPDLPIYPDHDVEIVFDTNMDDEDIDSINRIRYMMNLILRNTNTVNMAHYQNSVTKELFPLLKKSRKRTDEEVWPQEEYVWNRIDENSLKPPNRASFPYRPQDIFVPHNKVLLNQENDTNQSWNFAA